MDRDAVLLQILRDEYGITKPSQLDKAIEALGNITIAMFCNPPGKTYQSGKAVMKENG